MVTILVLRCSEYRLSVQETNMWVKLISVYSLLMAVATLASAANVLQEVKVLADPLSASVDIAQVEFRLV